MTRIKSALALAGAVCMMFADYARTLLKPSIYAILGFFAAMFIFR